MIRCVRLTTGTDGGTRFEEGELALPGGSVQDAIGTAFPASSVSFRETRPEDALGWHDAPQHQLVLTLGGTLEFTSRDGSTARIGPGDVLLAQDLTGSGHRWRILGDEPWRRAYVVLPDGVEAGFRVAP